MRDKTSSTLIGFIYDTVMKLPSFHSIQLLSLFLLIIRKIQYVSAVKPSATIELYQYQNDQIEQNQIITSPFLLLRSFNASQALFGPSLHFGKPIKQQQQYEPKQLVLPPNEDPLLCNLITPTSPSNLYSDKILLIPRGKCTFELKTYNAQQLGASGVIIYNTLSSKYDLNATNHIIWPMKYTDYDCDLAQSWIPKEYFSFDPLPYNSQINDPLLTGSVEQGNVCIEGSDTDCPSKRCLLTGSSMSVNNIENYEVMEACCAWDVYFDLGEPPRKHKKDRITIPTVYTKMEDGDTLLQLLQQSTTNQTMSREINKNNDIFVIIYEKDYPRWNVSSYLIWMISVFTIWYGSWRSARELRYMNRILEIVPIRPEREHDDGDRNGQAPVLEIERREMNIDTSSNVIPIQLESASNSDAQHLARESLEERNSREESSDYDDYDQFRYEGGNYSSFMQTGTFLIFASIVFLVFVFARILTFVRIFYGIIATFATIKVLLRPITRSIIKTFKKNPIFNSYICKKCRCAWLGRITWLEMLSIAFGLLWGILWIGFTYSVPYSGEYLFYWLTKDIFGACVCIFFIDIIRLDDIKMTAFLLIVVFCYDFFFIFVSKFFLQSNIKLFEETNLLADLCEKYPGSLRCVQNALPYPMVLTIPLINDYRHESARISLVEIALPGLLLSFSARLDASKRLLKTLAERRRAARRGITTNVTEYFANNTRTIKRRLLSGYLIWLTISYGFALFLKYLFQGITRDDSLGFLFLSPIVLFTIIALVLKRKEFGNIWHHHSTINAAVDVIEFVHVVGRDQLHRLPLHSGVDDDTVSAGSSNTSLGELTNDDDFDDDGDCNAMSSNQHNIVTLA